MDSKRVFILGDDLATPSGDPKGTGWLGRTIAKTENSTEVRFASRSQTNATSKDILKNWQLLAPELISKQDRVVVVIGNNDPAEGISISRSRLNLATLLDDAQRLGIAVFVLGPTPSANAMLNADIEHLSFGFEDVVKRRNGFFTDLYHPLIGHSEFLKELRSSPLKLPGAIGCGLISYLVLNSGWALFLDHS